jgi:hypothetical protein
VARFVIEQQHFRGIGDAVDAATCLTSYDLSRYPAFSKTFTEFYGRAKRVVAQAIGAMQWNTFVTRMLGHN